MPQVKKPTTWPHGNPFGVTCCVPKRAENETHALMLCFGHTVGDAQREMLWKARAQTDWGLCLPAHPEAAVASPKAVFRRMETCAAACVVHVRLYVCMWGGNWRMRRRARSSLVQRVRGGTRMEGRGCIPECKRGSIRVETSVRPRKCVCMLCFGCVARWLTPRVGKSARQCKFSYG